MRLRRFIPIASLLFSLCATLVQCRREYSYEAQPPAAIVQTDTTPAKPFLPPCQRCNAAAALPDSSWRFTVQGASLCGRADKAVINRERTAFTFFGPSACSTDSGFVVTVYLNAPLDADKANVPAGYVSVYYYDRIKPSYVMVSRPAAGFSLTIDRYNHQTGEAEGRFHGPCFTEGGEAKQIEAGRFRIRFP